MDDVKSNGSTSHKKSKSSDSSFLAPGMTIGGYKIADIIGKGGMAIVYRSVQLSLNRLVALKVLSDDFSEDPHFVTRFERESGVLAGLRHPNIVGIIDKGIEGNLYYFVMEYIEGTDLKELIVAGKLSVDECLRIMDQICLAMEYAHRNGVVHRDMKPANILIDAEGHVKVADFGLAHIAGHDAHIELTKTNTMMGTLNYMSPEQRSDAKDPDERSDLYSLGVVLYEMLTRRLPIGAFDMPSQMNPEVNKKLDTVLVKALRTDPNERYQTALEFHNAVREAAGVQGTDLAPGPGVSPFTSKTPLDIKLRGDCPTCGFENPSDRKTCQKCNADLGMLFDFCPDCGHDNRRDVAECSKCKINISDAREAKMQVIREVQINAKHLVDSHMFDEAIEELHKITNLKPKEFAVAKRHAESWVEQIGSLQSKWWERCYQTGATRFEKHRYDAAVRSWETIPLEFRDVADRLQAARQLRDKLLQAIELGNSFDEQEEVEKAIEQWEIAAKLAPEDREVKKKLSFAKRKVGKDRFADSLVEEAKLLLRDERAAEAVAVCKKVLDMEPNHAQAKELINAARQREHRSAIEAIVADGDRAAQNLKNDIAIAQWERALSLIRDNPQLEQEIQKRIDTLKSTLHDVRRRRFAQRGSFITLAVLTLVAVIYYFVPDMMRERNARSLYDQARLYESNREWDKAEQTLDLLQSRYGGVVFSDNIIRKDQQRLHRGKMESEAEDIFHKAQYNVNNGRLSEAVKNLELLLAQPYSDTSFNIEAKESLNDIETYRSEMNAATTLAGDLISKGKLEDAIREYDNALSKFERFSNDSLYRDAYVGRKSAWFTKLLLQAKIHEEEGNLDQAITSYEDAKTYATSISAAEIDTRISAVREQLQKERDAADAQAREAERRVEGTQKARRLLHQAVNLAESRDWTKVMAAIDAALAENPQSEGAASLREHTAKLLQAYDKMVLVPGGDFLMGEKGKKLTNPLRTETVDTLYIDAFEVSNAQFKKFDTDHSYDEGYDNHPAIVTAADAAAYAKWAGKKLPLEKQWEKAARGHDGRPFPWGEKPDEKKCNCKESGKNDSVPVDSYPSGISPYGAYNMSGNADEWVSTSDGGNDYVLKGGRYGDRGEKLHCGRRAMPRYDGYKAGFRCIRLPSSDELKPFETYAVEHPLE